MAKQLCPVCNETKLGFLNSEKMQDGKICENCEQKLGLKLNSLKNSDILENLTIEKAIKMIENGEKFDYKLEKEKKLQSKNEAKDVYNSLLNEFKDNKIPKFQGIYIDNESKRFLVPKTLTHGYHLENFSNLVSYDPILRTNNKSKHHGITRGIVGGALLGGAGAVVGAVTGHKNYSVISKMSILLRFKDNYTYEMKYITTDMSVGMLTNSFEKDMNEMSTFLDNIINDNTASSDTNDVQETSLADELIKYKQLLDAGALTQEEFDSQKAKLLAE